jgi:hypothetical protein
MMNPDFHFALAMDVYTAGVGSVLQTSVCTSPTVLEVLWSGLEFVMMVALRLKLFKEH